MPAKIRLQRHGKKGRPFFHIVIADGRAPRDGRFIEKIGTYNPLTRPAEIELDLDKAVSWLKNGAMPTDTVRAILSYKGVLYRYHLEKGVKKGAMTEEQAAEKFEEWLLQKNTKIKSDKNEVEQAVKSEEKKKLAVELKLNQAKSEAIAKKYAKEAAKEAAAAQVAEVEAAVVAIAEVAPVEVVVEEVPVETVAEEVPVEVVAEVEAAVEEAPAEVAEVQAAAEETPEAATEAPAED
jgi:small subunit ribosomal protein S16